MEKGKNERVEQILELIRQNSLRFSTGNESLDRAAYIDEINNRLTALEEDIQLRTTYLKSNQNRIDGILQVLMRFTMSDFTQRAEISDKGDELDAIALGLNTLAEELEASRSNEQKYIQELENANKELRSFTYIASHDLQEPLRNIKMFGNILMEREKEQLSEKGKQMLDKIALASTRMQKLIEGLLSFSRIQNYTDKLQNVDLNEVLAEIILAHDEDIQNGSLIVESTPLPIVNGIAFQLNQLFENIAGNAIKYSRPGIVTRLKISSELIKGASIPCAGAEPEKNYYRIGFTDQGIGFEQKYALRIFEIFQRLHGKNEYSGTGIGLAICKKIMQNHSGFIYAIGEVGLGSTFFVCLPAQ